MALIPRPPHTGNVELDSVLTYIVNQLNDGVAQPGFGGSGGTTPGAPGAPGEAGNSSIYLYARTMTNVAPDRPMSVSYSFENIVSPVTVNDMDSPWSPDLPADGGDYLWVTFRYVSGQTATITDPATWDTPSLLGTPGEDAITLLVQAFNPMGQAVGSDPTMWDPSTMDFRSNMGDPKALVARVYRGGTEFTAAEYATIVSYRWSKNSQTLYTPSAPQRADSGAEERILIVDATDITDSGSDVFMCLVDY